MADNRLTLTIEEYRCDPCSVKQGTVVRELIRMIPASVVMMGKLVGDEFFCCPICFEPKFEVKGRRPVKREKDQLGEVVRHSGGGAKFVTTAGPVLVKS